MEEETKETEVMDEAPAAEAAAPEVVPEAAPEKLFHCKVCHVNFATEEELEEHKKETHM
jgi:hypothetical protein